MRKTYLFDLYGTLIDLSTNEKKLSLWKNMARIYTAWGAEYTPAELKREFFKMDRAERKRLHPLMIEKFNAPDLELAQVECEIGVVFKDLFNRKGVEVSDELVAYTATVFRSVSTSYLTLFPGVIEMLDELHQKGCKAYLLSNAQMLYTKPEVISTGLMDILDGVMFSSDVGIMKPSPYFYREIMKKFNLDPKDCIMVGNEYLADIMGSNAVGLPSVFFHSPQSGDSFGPLPKNCIQVQSMRDVSSCEFE